MTELASAAEKCGFKVGWHPFRHTYRRMLRKFDDVPLEVQQKLMRHADIKTTLGYDGELEAERMRPVNARVIEMIRRAA